MTTRPNHGAAASRHPSGQSDSSGASSATPAADRAFPAAVAEPGRLAVCAIPLLAFATLLLVGCGSRFEPGYSLDDKDYFATRPHIALHTNTATYGLRWQYGSMGFYFQPRAKLVNGQLLFSLQGTSSSGALSGRYAELPITDPTQIRTLLVGGAFWLEPDGKKVRLTLTNL